MTVLNDATHFIIPNVFETAVFSGKNTPILFEHTADTTYRGETNRDNLRFLLQTAVLKEETAITIKKIAVDSGFHSNFFPWVYTNKNIPMKNSSL